jgi:signal transduction histidine kinase
METLGQVAVTLNHELNNSIAIIQLQLRLVSRQSSGGPDDETARRLRQIHESLGRMAAVLQSLKSLRRIVLTDYMPGMKMLDLERSVRPDDSEASLEAAHSA